MKKCGVTLTREEEREYNRLATEAIKQSNEDGLRRAIAMTSDRKFVVLTENYNH